jgi:hypothetical protein
VRLFFIPLFIGIIFFRPTILTLFQGQVSGFFLFLIVGMAWLWKKGKWFKGGILLGVLILKPNIGIIIIPLLAFWLLFQKRWTALLGTCFSGILLFTIGALYDINWLIGYWQIGSQKLAQTFGGSPTFWGLSTLIFSARQPNMLIFGCMATGLVLLLFLLAILRSTRTREPLIVIALAVTVTLLITPYTWTYDQLLLLIPITGITFALDRLGYRFSISSTIFLVIDILTFILVFPNYFLRIEILNVIIPLTVLGLCIWWLTLPINRKESCRIS